MATAQDGSRGDQSRARLLEAAVRTFAERGFYGTSTRDIASAAGMSPAALYVHHRSKEELLYVISRRGHQQTLDLVRAALTESTDPAEQLAAVVRAFAAYHAEEHTLARVVNYELAALRPTHLREITKLRRTITGEIRTLVERGAAAGRFHVPDPRIMAVAILSLGVDIARWYHDDGTWTPVDVATHYADLALRMVGTTPPP